MSAFLQHAEQICYRGVVAFMSWAAGPRPKFGVVVYQQDVDTRC